MKHIHEYRIDRLRLLACFGVVMLHSSYGSGTGDLALNAMFRFSVPIFVIISGYLLLSPPPPEKSNIWNKIYQLFVKMIVCSGIYLLYSISKGTALPDNIFLYLLTQPVHLWYIYATIGLYLLTPALIPFVRSADKEEYRYALILCFILGSCIVTLIRLDWFPPLAIVIDKSKLPDMLGFTGLYLLGGYFRKFGVHFHGWLILLILSTGISIAVSGTSLTEQLLSFLAPNVILSGCAVFALFIMLPDVPERFQHFVRTASECTMGVYLFHTLVCDLITPYLNISRQLLSGVIAMSVRGFCTFAVTIVLIWFLRKIPFLKKWML